MKDNSTILITILAVTAIILGVLLIPGTATANSADRTFDGTYISVTAKATNNTSLIYVIHVPTQQLAVYNGSVLQKKITLVQQPVDLAKVME